MLGLIVWPAALLVFVVWSLAAWLLFSMSDWAAGLLGGALAGVLSADFGPWAEWVLASLGNIIQAGVALTWLIVGLVILSGPIWLRRGSGSERPYAVADYAGRFDGGAGARGWRDGYRLAPSRWSEQLRDRYGDLERWRDMAGSFAGKGKKRKWRKRDRDDDDD